MNTRLLPIPSRAPHSARRADFSPVRSIRLTSSATPSAGATAGSPRAGVSTSGPLQIADFAAPPAWHRGALDRLQPILTRYRD